MSAIAYTIKDDHWYLHLHTFRPGMVIGRRGVTAQAILDDLREMSGDDRLALNLVGHDGAGCTARAETAP
jgi:ribosomal protein S3